MMAPKLLLHIEKECLSWLVVMGHVGGAEVGHVCWDLCSFFELNSAWKKRA